MYRAGSSRTSMPSAWICPRPVVGGAAGFHNDKADVAVMKTALELGSGQSGGSDRLPVRIGVGQLKDVLCHINGDSCSIHGGLLLVALTLTPHDASWHDDAERSGESIPSRDARNARACVMALCVLGEKYRE